MGIMVDHRSQVAPGVQEVITRYGGDILCRLGVPSPSKERGLITLVLETDHNTVHSFKKELETISGIEVQTMIFPQ
jgi:putative iron-only hydrogenase system regulator